MTDDQPLRGELYDELVRAMQKVPELAGQSLTLTPLSGGITNRNFRVDAAGTDERWVIRLAGNDTHLLGISREVEHAATVAAAGVGVGPEVTAFIRPEGYLVTRFIEGSPVSDAAVHDATTQRRVGETLRRIHDGPPIPGLFIPFRIVEAYRALAAARGVPIPPEYELAQSFARRVELACLSNPLECLGGAACDPLSGQCLGACSCAHLRPLVLSLLRYGGPLHYLILSHSLLHTSPHTLRCLA
jgi:hypothetical protein